MSILSVDDVVAGMTQRSQSLIIAKASIATQAAAGFSSLWRATGVPAQGAIPAAAIAGSNKDFYGVPSPAAAAVVTFFVWSCVDDSHSLFSWISGRVPFSGQEVLFVAAPLMLLTALSMVSSIRYNSFKKLNLAGRMRFLPFAAVVGVLALVAIDPPRVLFLAFFAYAASGPVALLLRRFKKPAA